MSPNVQTSERVYRGIWKVLAHVFRVPRAAPDLPAESGETILRFKPDAGWLRYLKTIFWIVLFITDLALLGGYIALVVVCIINDIWWLGVALFPVAAFLIVVPDIIAYVAIHLKYDTTWYVMSDRSMRIRRGIWSICEITITYENVQNVKVQQGPLQRHFGISNLIVETAGGGGATAGGKHGGGGGMHSGVIEGIRNASELRDRILARLRASRTAGLGDEAEEADCAGRQQHSWSRTEHVEALKAIRDELRALRSGSAPFIEPG